jgi:glutamate-1-semialdehyde 2,1-aminomutase
MADVRAVVAGGAYARFFHALVERGVVFAPGPYEVLFPGLSHSDADLAFALQAAGEAAAEVAAAWGAPLSG